VTELEVTMSPFRCFLLAATIRLDVTAAFLVVTFAGAAVKGA